MPVIEKPTLRRTACLLFALLFHFLFLHQSPGINLIIIELVLIGAYLPLSRKSIRVFSIPLLLIWALSLYGVLFVNSTLSLLTNTVAFILLFSSEWSPSGNLAENLVNAFRRAYPERNEKGKVKRKGLVFWLSYLFFPALLLFLFFMLYAHSVPFFYELFERIAAYLPRFSIESVLLFVLGTAMALYFWSTYSAEANGTLSQEQLVRTKTLARFKGLNSGYRRLANQAVLTLAGLILMGSLALILDMRYFWFSDQGAMDYDQAQWALRKGTGGLIVAILASMAVALYFFHGNMAFFSKSGLLKKLTYTWLCLNILLCFSLLVRTMLYIDQFNLAYKRIGVLAFIACAVFGIASILYQMIRLRNSWFLIRVNLFSFLLTFLVLGSFNWDRLIVTYNFKHPEAYQDLDFLFTRELGVLLNTDIDPAILEKNIQGSKNREWLLKKYGPISYRELLDRRVAAWKSRNERDWRSWTLPRSRTERAVENWQ